MDSFNYSDGSLADVLRYVKTDELTKWLVGDIPIDLLEHFSMYDSFDYDGMLRYICEEAAKRLLKQDLVIQKLQAKVIDIDSEIMKIIDRAQEEVQYALAKDDFDIAYMDLANALCDIEIAIEDMHCEQRV